MPGQEQTKRLRDYVYERVKAYQKGFLYSSICVILGNDPEIARRVCREFSVVRKNSLEEDLRFLDRWSPYTSGEGTLFNELANAANDIFRTPVSSVNLQGTNTNQKERMENIDKNHLGCLHAHRHLYCYLQLK